MLYMAALHGMGRMTVTSIAPDLRAQWFLFIISLKIAYLIRFVWFIFVLTKINLTGKAFCPVKRSIRH